MKFRHLLSNMRVSFQLICRECIFEALCCWCGIETVQVINIYMRKEVGGFDFIMTFNVPVQTE
jgi:hypothetical protein